MSASGKYPPLPDHLRREAQAILNRAAQRKYDAQFEPPPEVRAEVHRAMCEGLEKRYPGTRWSVKNK